MEMLIKINQPDFACEKQKQTNFRKKPRKICNYTKNKSNFMGIKLTQQS